MRLIDADNTISELRHLPEQERLEYMGVYDLLKSMPTIDAESSCSSLGEAIQDVQDMIDVLDVTGSAYVYRHNGGRKRLVNICSCLKALGYQTRTKDETKVKWEGCKKVEFGSYDCYIKVPKYNISCDKCLATEILMLNDMGIRTIGCCCGHGKSQGYIQVSPNMIVKMKELGYEELPLDDRGNGSWCFAPKSVLMPELRRKNGRKI